MIYHCDLVVLVVVFVIVNIKPTTPTPTQDKLELYAQYVNTSLLLEKQDKVNMKTWTENLQVQMVEVTSKYRLEMTRHQQHSFKTRQNNEKWKNCLKLYKNTTTKLEQAYYMKENQCLKTASSADADKRQTVTQIGREIRKWRRSYRYLMNLCRSYNPGDEKQAGGCLEQYMERDNYSNTFQRLINLRSKAIEEMHSEMNKSVINLEECLKITLSEYLEKVRVTMEALSKCYGDGVTNEK